jgi:o-succinylbenzoate---CoA ligase
MNDHWLQKSLRALEATRGAERPPLEFLPAESGAAPQWIERPDALGTGAAVVVRTSGSTGTPKQTLLSWEALNASAEMTAQALGGHGQWLLALQPSYVAGLAVLTRSIVGGTEPVSLLEDTTDPDRFSEAAEQLTADRRFVSLVPTQLQRLLTDPSQRLLAALRSFDAILLGGAPTRTELFDRARGLDLKVIRTYGMAETCGGCVYDGYPLPGVTVEMGTHGRVLLSGPMVALGYHEDPELTAEKFEWAPDARSPQGTPIRLEEAHYHQGRQRRFRTDDLGQLSTQRAAEVDTVAEVSGAGHSAQIVPRLTVTGRADSVLITGGVKVSAEEIRRALESHASVREAFVAGVDDIEWGQKIVAAVVLSTASRVGKTFEELDQLISDHLSPAAVPKHYELLGALPLLPNGKPDRQALIETLKRGAAHGQNP